MSDRPAERALDALYAELPTIRCKGLCARSCGPIKMSRVEWRRILRRKGQAAKKLKPGLTCPMLTAVGRCSVYSNRPMLCRLWGLTEDMPCVFGCVPENGRLLTPDEGREFLRRSMDLGS